MSKFWVILVLLFWGQSVFALDVVYPKKEAVTINSPATFFIGSSKSDFTVNGQPVKLHSSGGFAHFVALDEGENVFELKSEDEVKIYVITRPVKSKQVIESRLIEYTDLKYFETVSDNVPLRSTPIDGGINRISHLQKGVSVVVDGEKGGFYRVKLSLHKKAWISKNNLKQAKEFGLAEISGYNYVDSKDYYTFVFYTDRKIPFEIIEGGNFRLKFYNVKDKKDGILEFEFPYEEMSGTKKIVGYSGEYIGDEFVFKIRKFPEINLKKPLKGITITIDPGHGGKELGAIGCLGDREKDVVLKISMELKDELSARGANVVMTREKDVYLGLYDRIKIANENDSMFLISVHANALPDRLNPLEHRGTSVYYFYNQAKLLSAYVLNNITAQAETQNDKIRQESFAIVRNTKALSILVETAYLINPEDNAMLINPLVQKRIAKALADGLEEYLVK